jgi:hypothetical protein
MPQIPLTHEIIRGCIAGSDGGEVNAKAAGIIRNIFFVLAAVCLLLPDMLWFSLVCVCAALLCMYLSHKNAQAIRFILEKKYTLKLDICENKKTVTSSEPGSDTYYFIFRDHGRLELHFPFVVANSTAVAHVPNLYDSTEPGDSFYLLCSEKGKVLYVFNRKYWSLSDSDFSQLNGIFTPNQ